nr:LytR C-terminal domain-containing protein [Acidimicrobiia bacterium]
SGSSVRGALLLGAAVLVGVVLLGKGLESGVVPSTASTPSEEADGGDTDTTATTGADGAGGTTVPTPVSHAPAEVRVQVLNGGGPSGSAATSATALTTLAFTALPVGDTSPDVPASIVYFQPGYDADGAAVATALGITTPAQPLPATPPTGTPAEANVVVILGPDFTPPA